MLAQRALFEYSYIYDTKYHERRGRDLKLTVSVPRLDFYFSTLIKMLNRASNPSRKRPTLSPLAKYIRFAHYFAEREGFEPSIRFPVCLISSQVPSTTQPPLHIITLSQLTILRPIFAVGTTMPQGHFLFSNSHCEVRK